MEQYFSGTGVTPLWVLDLDPIYVPAVTWAAALYGFMKGRRKEASKLMMRMSDH